MDTNEFNQNSAPRRKAPPAKQQRKKRGKVVYTEAKPFNRRRFLLQLVTVFAVVLALLLGLSIFFKSRYVMVSCVRTAPGGGTISTKGIYTADEVRKAAGIQDDDNLLLLNKAKIAGRITKNLPYVKSVRVEVKLPDTVLIEITEIDVTYAVQSSDNQWWLMDKDGKIVDNISAAEAKSHTQVLGVKLAAPKLGETAVAQELPTEETTAEGETTQVTVFEKERLAAVLVILPNLEKNGLVGTDVVSVDVSNMGNIEIWYKEQYQVLLGDHTQLETKVAKMAGVIEQNDEYDSGILDISYTINPDQVIKTPFGS